MDCWNSPAAQEQYEDSSTTFGDVPKDIVLEILSLAAPYVPDIVPLNMNDIESYQRGEPIEELWRRVTSVQDVHMCEGSKSEGVLWWGK